jgi:hypothetical protein
MGMFSEKANFLYFKQCYSHTIMCDEDWAERQADFVKYLYHMCTEFRGKMLDKIWRETKQLMMEELNNLAEEKKRIQEERARKTDENETIKREAVKAGLLRAVEEARARRAAEAQIASNSIDAWSYGE